MFVYLRGCPIIMMVCKFRHKAMDFRGKGYIYIIHTQPYGRNAFPITWIALGVAHVLGFNVSSVFKQGPTQTRTNLNTNNIKQTSYSDGGLPVVLLFFRADALNR